MKKNTFKKIEIGNCTLYNGDCFDILPTDILPTLDIQAHAVITDPPYGISDCKWDKALPLARFWEMVKAKTLPTANFVLFACGKFTIDLVNSNRKWYRSDLIWVKNNQVGFLNAKKQPMRNHESILVFAQPGYKNQATYNPQKEPGGRKAGIVSKNNTNNVYRLKGNYTGISDGMRHPGSVLFFNHDRGNNQKGLHPTMKPLALMEFLIRSYSHEGDLVIDPFMGSGTTGLACSRLNRKFIGIELESEYYKMAIERIKNQCSVGKE